MALYHQPDPELTEEEKLLAEVILVDQKIPCGFQVGMPVHLDNALRLVETLFTVHNLPLKDELLRELRSWRAHAERGLAFSQQCERLMQKVIRVVESTCPR
jgi:hypothetical protein